MILDESQISSTTIGRVNSISPVFLVKITDFNNIPLHRLKRIGFPLSLSQNTMVLISNRSPAGTFASTEQLQQIQQGNLQNFVGGAITYTGQKGDILNSICTHHDVLSSGSPVHIGKSNTTENLRVENRYSHQNGMFTVFHKTLFIEGCFLHDQDEIYGFISISKTFLTDLIQNHRSEIRRQQENRSSYFSLLTNNEASLFPRHIWTREIGRNTTLIYNTKVKERYPFVDNAFLKNKIPIGYFKVNGVNDDVFKQLVFQEKLSDVKVTPADYQQIRRFSPGFIREAL